MPRGDSFELIYFIWTDVECNKFVAFIVGDLYETCQMHSKDVGFYLFFLNIFFQKNVEQNKKCCSNCFFVEKKFEPSIFFS